jgi:hypothetical protein
MFGFSGVLIEVTAVTFEALGETESLPVGGFVEGAGVFFGIVKTLSQKGLEAVSGFEFAAEGAQGESEALAGEVGAADAVDDVEAPELNDELESVGACDGVPSDMVVALFEAFGGSAPAKRRHEFGTVRLIVGAVDPLPEDVSGGTSGFEVVTFIESLAEVGDLGFF